MTNTEFQNFADSLLSTVEQAMKNRTQEEEQEFHDKVRAMCGNPDFGTREVTPYKSTHSPFYRKKNGFK